MQNPWPVTATTTLNPWFRSYPSSIRLLRVLPTEWVRLRAVLEDPLHSVEIGWREIEQEARHLRRVRMFLNQFFTRPAKLVSLIILIFYNGISRRRKVQGLHVKATQEDWGFVRKSSHPQYLRHAEDLGVSGGFKASDPAHDAPKEKQGHEKI